jgi:hypothetical protein
MEGHPEAAETGLARGEARKNILLLLDLSPRNQILRVQARV